MIIGFLVKNVNEFDEEIQTALNKYSQFIQEKAVTTTLYLAHESREFSELQSGKKPTKVIYHTSKDSQEKIDDVDEEILRIIANNARLPITELAQKIKTTPRICQYRIKNLEKRNIILAYKSNLDTRKMNKIFCKVIIYLANTTKDRLNKFISYASSIDWAIWPQRVLGTWDFELDLEVENYEKFQDVIIDLKEKFPDVIKNHEFCILSKEYKLDLYPNAYQEGK